MSEAILVGENLTKIFDKLTVVKGASIAVQEGEFVSLVGKSGCGKTTLLSILSGLERPTSGRVTIAGRRFPAHPRTNWPSSAGRTSGSSSSPST